MADDVDDDGDVEIVTGGSHYDSATNAQLVVWSSDLETVENLVTWRWGTTTFIESLTVGDVDSDGSTEIVTGGEYYDSGYCSQLVIWDGSTLAVGYLTAWQWGVTSIIESIAVGNTDGDAAVEIITGGFFHDSIRNCAQITLWEID